MKKKLITASCLLALLPALTLANEGASQEQIMAQRCLAYGLAKLKTSSPELYAKLQVTKPDPDTARLELLDENIGSQHIATRVTASLETKKGVEGDMLCLMENDKPLFVDFHNLYE